jgi:plasmid stability protein
MHQDGTTTLTIRNVAASTKERLRVRAASHGRSMEAELRAILNAALESRPDREVNLAEAIRRRFAPVGGVELADHPREFVGDPPDFVS